MPDGNPFVELHVSATGQVEEQRSFLFVGGRLLARFDEAGSIEHIVTDHIGFPIMSLGQSANMLWEADAMPFGEIAETFAGDDTTDPLHRYPGQWAMDEALNPSASSFHLFYNGYRWYNPGWGRYTQVDPLLSLYGYCYAESNPQRHIDTYGLFTQKQIKKSCKCGGLDPKEIFKEVSNSCVNLSMITDKNIRDCVRRRCDSNGKIKCKSGGLCQNQSKTLRTYGYNPQRSIGKITIWISKAALLCKNNATPKGVFPGHIEKISGDRVTIGNVVIHEWAHSCGWNGGGGGVPLDRGPE